MKIVYACVDGKTHLENSIPCQDVASSYITDNLSIAVLCDGAGSKKYGRRSAEILSDAVVKYFKSGIGDFDSEKFIAKLTLILSNNGLDEKNSGATLLFVVIENNDFLIGHLGDGVIIKGTNDVFKAISLPKNGHLANLTHFLPASDAQDHFEYKLGKVDSKNAFIMATDGAADLLYDHKTLSGYSACQKLAVWVNDYEREEAELILQDNLREVFSKYSSDDLSIAVIKL